MEPSEFCRLAERLMRCPAAPGHELAVRSEAERICAEHGLASRRDPFGNLQVRLQTDRSIRPVALAAHLDHPGFEVLRPRPNGRWQARFLGGVPEPYFRRGVPLRLMPGAVPALLGKKLGTAREFEIIPREWAAVKLLSRPARGAQGGKAGAKFSFAVWELPDFERRGELIHGRACDDLIGVAATLATLIELKRRRARVNVLGLLSRAEEVGFYGALTLAESGKIPKEALIISLETSRELPPAKQGHGMILRVGDRASVFDAKATRFLGEVAARLQSGAGFACQRALMSGGTCEATAYQEHGFQTAAVCIALGNYHNGGEHNRIAAECVNVADACGMVRFLVEVSRQMRAYSKLTAQLPKRLQGLLKKAHRMLK